MLPAGYGKIINTASMSGSIVNWPQNQAAYNTSKAGVIHLTGLRSLRQLDLYHTLVSEKGFQQLKTALPECQMHYERDSARRERRS